MDGITIFTYLLMLAIGAFFIALATGLGYGTMLLFHVSPWIGVPAFLFSLWVLAITAVAFSVHCEDGGF